MSKLSLLLTACAFCSAFAADLTPRESAKDAKRAAKKTVHRVSEAVCTEGDAVCLAKKGKHRVEEGVDKVNDKAE